MPSLRQSKLAASFTASVNTSPTTVMNRSVLRKRVDHTALSIRCTDVIVIMTCTKSTQPTISCFKWDKTIVKGQFYRCSSTADSKDSTRRNHDRFSRDSKQTKSGKNNILLPLHPAAHQMKTRIWRKLVVVTAIKIKICRSRLQICTYNPQRVQELLSSSHAQ